ncbi:hypothetical protein CEXT_110901 [Caerostris extrusa]|uniref:Uncharacterized protein n=1 Tax=Caerostris extrusa TaxID=172846 RepID=A0AAV4W8H4_CAEEX|nr:hypothetical protein CEXT_110901 [Caerostris extrusa]
MYFRPHAATVEMADEHSNQWPLPFLKPISATYVHSDVFKAWDRSALCWIVMKWVRTVFMLQENDILSQLVVVLISTVKMVTKSCTLNKKDVYQYV